MESVLLVLDDAAILQVQTGIHVRALWTRYTILSTRIGTYQKVSVFLDSLLSVWYFSFSFFFHSFLSRICFDKVAGSALGVMK